MHVAQEFGMIRASFFVLMLVMQGGAMGTGAEESVPVRSVASLRDQFRPLLVFSPGHTKAFCEQAKEIAAHEGELAERQVAVYFLLSHDAEGGALCVTPAVTGIQYREPPLRSTGFDDSLFRRYRVGPSQFTILLIGKDGGEKLRSLTPVTMETVTQLIDSMPMRQKELRDGHSGQL
jgi:Domain of unknown function (DUF4174)